MNDVKPQGRGPNSVQCPQPPAAKRAALHRAASAKKRTRSRSIEVALHNLHTNMLPSIEGVEQFWDRHIYRSTLPDEVLPDEKAEGGIPRERVVIGIDEAGRGPVLGESFRPGANLSPASRDVPC